MKQKQMPLSVEKNYNYVRTFMRKRIQLVVLFAITVVTLLLSAWSALGLRDYLTSSTEKYMDDTAKRMADNLYDIIELKKEEIITVADSLGQVDLKDTEGVVEFLERKAGLLDFDMLVLVDQEGNYLLTSEDEDVLHMSMQEFLALEEVQRTFAGEVLISYPGGETVYYSCPVRQKDEITSVLVGIRSKEKMQSVIESKDFDQSCMTFIVDSEGSLLLSPADTEHFAQIAAVYEKDSAQTQRDMRTIEENFALNPDNGFYPVSIGGQDYYLIYNSLQVNDWALITIASAEVVVAGARTYTLRFVLLIACVLLIFCVFWFVLYYIYNENRKTLMEQAFVDNVTGGMNNAAFRMAYQNLCQEKAMSDHAIAFLNILDFKLINEELGVKNGNKILSYIYETIQKHLDEGRGEFAARSEMDHFFLCLKGKHPEILQNRLAAIVEDVNAGHEKGILPYPLIFRQGICLAEEDAADVMVLQEHARIASQKKAGSVEHSCIFYDKSFIEKIKNEKELDTLFESSLENHDFQVYLQPKVNPRDGRIVGAEALVRWMHPAKGCIYPKDFIPLFERIGKICRLDLYVFEEVCKIMERWKQEKRVVYPISVNLSRYHYHNPGFLQDFYNISKQYDVSRELIEFELTESIFFEEDVIQEVKKSVRQFHRLGFRCALDDFGSGFSSLGLLKEFDVDTLKLDRSFFVNMAGEKAKSVISSIAELAAKLQIQTVAEGIETQEQLAFLRSIPCDQVQGYIFSKPVPVEEFERMTRAEMPLV